MHPFRVKYETIEFNDIDIHIRSLRDKQEFSDPFGEAESLGISSSQWSLFGIVWESGKLLAKTMDNFNTEGKRILEIGCGMALPSLLLNAKGADVTATDYHPEAASFLAENAKLNQSKAIPFLRTNWIDCNDGLGQFDVLIGADLLYEHQQIDMLIGFIDRHAKPECEIVLVDPGRRHTAAFSKRMGELGYSLDKCRSLVNIFIGDSSRGKVLYFYREQ